MKIENNFKNRCWVCFLSLFLAMMCISIVTGAPVFSIQTVTPLVMVLINALLWFLIKHFVNKKELP